MRKYFSNFSGVGYRHDQGGHLHFHMRHILFLICAVVTVPAYAGGAAFDFRLGLDRTDVQNCNEAALNRSFSSDEYYGDRIYTSYSNRCDDMAYKVFGGIDYNRDLWMVGGELGYWSGNGIINGIDTKRDTLSDSTQDQEADNLYYGVRLGLNFWQQRLTPYVTGGFHTRELGTLRSFSQYGSALFENADPYYGLGVEYDFWQLRDSGAFSLYGKWERYDFGNLGGVDFYGMSVLYEFDL